MKTITVNKNRLTRLLSAFDRRHLVLYNNIKDELAGWGKMLKKNALGDHEDMRKVVKLMNEASSIMSTIIDDLDTGGEVTDKPKKPESDETERDPKKDFEKYFQNFMKGAQKICNEYKKKNDNSKAYGQKLGFTKGKKYIRIFSEPEMGSGKSAWAFIDTTTGDVLKPASWKTPAKGARGNIFDKHNGLGRVDAYGPAYNK